MFITQASIGYHTMQAVLGRQKGDHGQDVPSVDCGNWGRERTLYCVLAFRERHII